jgi:RecA-family ATPase
VRTIESEIYHFAGRIPNYGKFKDEITLKFTSKSKEKVYDPVLSFQLSNDFHELRVLKIT